MNFVSISLLSGLTLSTKGVVAQEAVKERKLSLRIDHASLDEAVHLLEEKSGVHFIFKESLMGGFQINNFSITGKSAREILKELLANTKLSFRNYQNQGDIIIVPTNNVVRPIKGRVIDAKTGEPMAGVTIREKGTANGTVSDGNGNFTINATTAAPVFIASYIGYTNLEAVESGGALVFKLRAVSKQINEVVVQARRRIDNQAAVLLERKNSSVVSDGISARQIEKTASITTTQALQRVSGITITDDKYVAIRGLGDRSVIAELNGVRLSAANPDRSAVPLDLIPAALLDNVTVYKTVTPDRPADASGGIIELKTKSVPDSATFTVIAETGTNSNIGIGGKFNAWDGYGLGFFGQHVNQHNLSPGFLNLQNQYPRGTNQINQLFADSRNSPAQLAEATRVSNIMHEFSPTITTSYQAAHPNQIYSATFGNSYRLFGKNQLGIILGLSYYDRTEDITGGQLNQWSILQGVVTGDPNIYSPRYIPPYISPNNINLGKYLSYQENTGTETLNYGVLAGLTYRFNARNEISIQYNTNYGSDATGTQLLGKFAYSGLPGPVYNTIYSLKQTFRTLNVLNLQGEHKLWNHDYAPRISYNLSSSNSSENDPDYRFIDLADYKTPNPYVLTNHVGATDIYALITGVVSGFGNGTTFPVDPNGRRFRKLTENNYNFKGDAEIPFPVGGRRQVLKIGYNHLLRNRNFTENVLQFPGSSAINGINDTGSDPLYAVNGNLSQLVTYDKIGLKNPSYYDGEGAPPTAGYVYNIRKSPNNYKGFYQVEAFYGMLDLKPMNNLRLIGGVRFELTNIHSSVDTGGVIGQNFNVNPQTFVFNNPTSGFKTLFKPYYSANLVYTIHTKTNLRLAYSSTLARPELRELTNTFEFDPFQFALVVGNPSLRNQLTRSYDFRYEFFPSSGEVFSISAFYKTILNQLTKEFSLRSAGETATAPEFPTVAFFNDPNQGKVYGIELEVVKDLGKIYRPLKYLFFGTNILLDQSSITKNPPRDSANQIIDRRSPGKSPLFEQAPYSVNTYLDYDNPHSGTSVNVSFNVVGERLILVNLTGEPDIYSRPVPLLDFTFSQKLGKHIMIKGFAKNVLDHAYENRYENPQNNGHYYGSTYIQRSYHRGREYILGITYNLF